MTSEPEQPRGRAGSADGGPQVRNDVGSAVLGNVVQAAVVNGGVHVHAPGGAAGAERVPPGRRGAPEEVPVAHRRRRRLRSGLFVLAAVVALVGMSLAETSDPGRDRARPDTGERADPASPTPSTAPGPTEAPKLPAAEAAGSRAAVPPVSTTTPAAQDVVRPPLPPLPAPPSATASEPLPQPGAYAPFASARSGKCLGPVGESRREGAAVIQWTCQDHAHEQWAWVAGYGPDTFKVVNRSSGLCLDSTDNTVVQKQCGDSDGTQLWHRQRFGTDNGWAYWYVTNVHARLCLDDPAGSMEDGTQLGLWPCDNSQPQQFRTPV